LIFIDLLINALRSEIVTRLIRIQKMRFITFILIILFSSSLQAQSSDIIQFNNGEIADADDVNSNFNNLDDRVKALEADNAVSTSCSQSDLDGKW